MTGVGGGWISQFIRNPDRATSEIVDHFTELASAGLSPVAATFAILGIARVAATWFIRRRDKRMVRNARLVEIAMPPETQLESANAFWTHLHDLLRPRLVRLVHGQPHLSFEMMWRGPELKFQVWVPEAVPLRIVEQAAQSAWPGAMVATADSSLDPFAGAHSVLGGEFRLQTHEWLPIGFNHEIDPLRGVIGSVGELSDGQSAVVQILARPVTGKRTRKAQKRAVAIQQGKSVALIGRVLDAVGLGTVSNQALSNVPNRSQDARLALTKTMSLGWEVLIRYGVSDQLNSKSGKADLKIRAHGLASSFALFSGRNRLQRKRRSHVASAVTRRTLRKGDLFSVAELAAIAHLPTDVSIPGVIRAGARPVAPTTAITSVGRTLGDSQGMSVRPLAITPKDACYHSHVLGSTGSGKSTLLTNMVMEDVDSGRGAVVIDPKGDLITDILERLPVDTAHKVVLLDPSNSDIAPALDVLGGDNKELAVENIVGIFRRIFESHWGPRTDDILRSACLTLARNVSKAPSLADVPSLLSDEKVRKDATLGIDDPAGLGGFWSWYETMSDAQRSQVVGPVMNKLRSFFLRDFVRRVVGPGAKPLDFEEVLNGRLLLVRIPKGIVGDETSKLLGSLVVAKVWQAALSRSQTDRGSRRVATLYVDECQNFLNLPRSFDEMLAEARGYGLSLVLAHQHLGQLSRELRDAISSNARNKLFFNMSPEDARMLSRHFEPELNAYDLSHLGAYQLGMRLVVNGREQPACTALARDTKTVSGDYEALLAKLRETSKPGPDTGAVAVAKVHNSLKAGGGRGS